MSNQPTWTNERRKLSELIPWERNPRQIKDKQAKRLIESFDDFGQVETIAVDPDNNILNGHQRLSVLAGQHGMDYEVDVRVASRPLTEKERERLTIFLHHSAAGEWDLAALAEWDTNDLLSWDFDLSAFDVDVAPEPDEGKDTEPLTDKAEELREKWQTAEGQIWQIDKHFVICGDCRNPDDWKRLLQAAGVDKVNGVFTSPPYAEQRKDQYGGTPTDQYVEWWDLVQSNVKANLAQDGSFFVNIKAHCEDGQRVLYCMDLVCAMVRRWEWHYNDELSWIHGGIPGAVVTKFKNQFEPIYQFCKNFDMKMRPNNVRHFSDKVPQGGGGVMSAQQGTGMAGDDFDVSSGLAYPGNVLSVGKANETHGHAAAFPVALPDFFIRAYSDAKDVWLDPFLGSGTTIVAAHNNNRIGLGIERLPKYLGVILERLQTHTGQEPVLIE